MGASYHCGHRQRTAGWLCQKLVKAVFDYHLAIGTRSFDSAQPNAKAKVSRPFASLRMTDLERETFAEFSSGPNHPKRNSAKTCAGYLFMHYFAARFSALRTAFSDAISMFVSVAAPKVDCTTPVLISK